MVGISGTSSMNKSSLFRPFLPDTPNKSSFGASKCPSWLPFVWQYLCSAGDWLLSLWMSSVPLEKGAFSQVKWVQDNHNSSHPSELEPGQGENSAGFFGSQQGRAGLTGGTATRTERHYSSLYCCRVCGGWQHDSWCPLAALCVV